MYGKLWKNHFQLCVQTVDGVVVCSGEKLRPARSADDVRVENGSDVRQGSLLCIRSSVLGHRLDGPEGENHGSELHSWQEGRSVRQEHPEVSPIPHMLK